MDLNQITSIMNIVHLIMLGFALIGACLYAIPICFVRQFHKPIHLLTLNVCIAVLVCSAFWIIFYTMDAYYPLIFWNAQSCLPIAYLENVVNGQVFYSLAVVSLTRLFTIVYKNKPLFQTKRWAGVCVSAQWIFAALLPVPILFLNGDSCLIYGLEFNYRIYEIIIGIVIPTISSIITNSVIFIYTHRSTRRVRSMNENSAQAPILSHRDARLLKHMIFLIVAFHCGCTPTYIVLAINTWTGTAISPIVLQIFLTLPTFNLFIDVGNLFLYNHELRRYLTNQRQIVQHTGPRE